VVDVRNNEILLGGSVKKEGKVREGEGGEMGRSERNKNEGGGVKDMRGYGSSQEVSVAGKADSPIYRLDGK